MSMRPFHPIADAFPMIEGEEFDQLVASIKASDGPREPIIVYEGMILDGRNRARACEAAAIEPPYSPLPVGADPIAFVIDKNLRRRHLNESQRAMVAAKLTTLDEGRPSKTAPIGAVSQTKAAELLNYAQLKRFDIVLAMSTLNDVRRMAVLDSKPNIVALKALPKDITRAARQRPCGDLFVCGGGHA